MKIAVACDHGALNLKSAVIAYVEKLGHTVVDFGTTTFDSCDYPDFAAAAARAARRSCLPRIFFLNSHAGSFMIYCFWERER